MMANLSATLASLGNSSQICMPGTLVLIGLNSPRISVGASGFRSHISKCEGPPGQVDIDNGVVRTPRAGLGFVLQNLIERQPSHRGSADLQKASARESIAKTRAFILLAEDGEHDELQAEGGNTVGSRVCFQLTAAGNLPPAFNTSIGIYTKHQQILIYLVPGQIAGFCLLRHPAASGLIAGFG